MQPLKRGDVITLKTFTLWSKDVQLTYGAHKGKHYVMVLLGQEDDAGSPLDLDSAMHQIGWKPIE